MSNSSRALAAVQCLATGGLIALAMPPWGWWPLAFAGFATTDALLDGRGASARFWRGFGIGAGWLFPAMFWMIDLTAPGYLVAGLVFSALFGAAAMACPPGAWRWLALPGAVVLFEAVRWRFPFGGVPLATLPMSQVDGPLGPVVRLLGPLQLSWLTVVAGMALAALYRRHLAVAGAAVAAVVVSVLLAGAVPDGEPIGELDVALVQGGGPQRTLAINTDERVVFERHLEASALVQTPVDLVLWPEDVVHVRGPIEEAREYGELRQLAGDLDAVLVAGIFETRITDTTNRNASIVLTPDGSQVDRYDKVRIVPFGEYVPLRSIVEPFAPSYLPPREVERGSEPPVLVAPLRGRQVPLGIGISWEVFFEDRARSAVANGGELLLNPTNGSSYWLTIVQTQQIASSQLRALETGRWVLQVAPTGFSAIVGPDGEVVARTAISEREVLHATVELRAGRTVASRVGPWPMIGMALASLAVAWTGQTGRLPDRRRRSWLEPRTGFLRRRPPRDGWITTRPSP